MDSMIVSQVAVLGVLMVVGVIARKANIINDTISKGLSEILMKISLPAMIISAFEIKFSKEMLGKVILIVFVSIIIHAILVLLSRISFRKYDIDKKNVLNIFVIFPNAGFMGLPFIYALFGDLAVLYASIFLVPHHILLWTYGQGLFIEKNKANKKKMGNITKHIKNPAIMAVIIGLVIFIFSIKIPFVLSRPMNMLGAITSPLAMMIVGDRIAQIKPRDIFSDKDVYIGTLYRLIIAPILTLLVLQVFTTDILLISVCVTIHAIPAAISTVIFPQKFNGDPTFGSKCVVVSHVFSIITIPLILMFL